MSSVALRQSQRVANRILHSDSRKAQSTHILITVPRTALPTDVRRLCAKHKIENVSHVALDYFLFTPTGYAWINLTSPNFVPSALKALTNCVVGGTVITSYVADPGANKPLRTRGLKGRTEAVERGIVAGTGLDGGLTLLGRGVVLYGLPGRMSTESLQKFLKNFKLAGTEGGQQEIVKLSTRNAPKYALTSRYFVRLASVSEAHRLVRKLHMTYYEPDFYGTHYPIHAHVVY